MKMLIALVVICFAATSSARAPDISADKFRDAVVIAVNSNAGVQAALPIVISDRASVSTKAVATELAGYLGRITGATFEVKAGDGSTGIVLGTLGEFPNPDLDKPLAIHHVFDGREAYAIRTKPNRLLLIGATELGVSHAAFRLLEELGCRWFFPGKNWEVVPSISKLQFHQNITDRPSILSRNIWYGWSLFNDAGHPDKKSAAADYQAWKRHNQQAESFVINAGHALFQVIDLNRAEFDKHSEYFALTGGKRQGPQIELGNPAVRLMVVEYARNFFRQNPSADMVSVDPADGGGYSESEESKKLGTPSDAIFGMANEVARVLQKEFPGKMVGLYAYNWHSDPPSFELEPNVYVQLTMGFAGGKYTLDELFELWPRQARNLGFYDYYSVWRWDFDRWPGGRIANVNYAKEMFRRFTQANATSGGSATSVSAESSNNWGANGRGYYLANKMMWNPQVDVDATLREFYLKAFGPGAAAMQRYYEMADAKPLMTPGVIGLLFRDVDSASRAAKDRPDVQARLDDIKNYLRYEHLNYLKDHEPDAAKAAMLEQEIWKLVYRTRYSYMNHWEAIRQDWIKEDQKPADTPKPWKVDASVTHDETDKAFREGLAYFPDLTIPVEVKFSTDLVPVRFPVAPSSASYQNYQEGARYILCSVHGEPLEMTITAGTAYGGLRQSYLLADAEGRVIASGKPKPGEVLPLHLEVPKAGFYFFKYEDGGAYWEIAIPPDHSYSIPLQKENGYRTMKVMQEMYFYVPKGTRQIEYYFARTPWQAGGPHKVVAPDGTIVRDVKTSGEYVIVPVPPGMDGKPWSFKEPSFGHFFFFNVPNYLAASPGALLLPREVAARDGLEIRK